MPDRTLLLCTCEDTMPLDGASLERLCRGTGSSSMATQLCRRELQRFREALGGAAPLVVACTQEAPRFEELRE